MKSFTNAVFDPRTKSFLVSASNNSFANGVQYFLEKVGDLNSEGRVREVFLIVKESESTKKVVLGIELTPNMTVWPTFGLPTFSAKVTEQTFLPDSKLQHWIKSGILNQIKMEYLSKSFPKELVFQISIVKYFKLCKTKKSNMTFQKRIGCIALPNRSQQALM